MKLVARILKIISIVLFILLTILFIISLLIQNRVGTIVLHTVNNSLATKIETGSYRLSLIKKFPRASVELKDVFVRSSPGISPAAFRGTSTDTLLKAESASIDLRMSDLVRGVYTFTSISVRNGSLNLYTDEKGITNYDLSAGRDTAGSGGTNINLNRIMLHNVRFLYNDLRAGLLIKGKFTDARFKSRIRNENIDFSGVSGTEIDLFRLKGINISHTVPMNIDIGLNKNIKGTFFRKTTFGIGDWKFIMNGFVASDNYIDLTVAGENIDISGIPELLPEQYKKAAADFIPSGSLKFESSVKGKSSRTEDPHYDIKASLDNARIASKRSDLKVERISFGASYSNGSGNSRATSTLDIGGFSARFGSTDYSGSFLLTDFTNPRAELEFRGKVLPAEIVEFLNLKNIGRASGSIDVDLNFRGYPGKKKSFQFRDVFNLNSQSKLAFNAVGFEIKNRNAEVKEANGTIVLKETSSTGNLSLLLNNQKISMSGTLDNLPGWLAGNPVILKGSATVEAGALKPESFMSDGEKDVETAGKDVRAIRLPADVMIGIGFRVDTLEYKKFHADNLSGNLSIAPRSLNFTDLKLNSQKGKISGNGVVAQNSNKSFIGKGNFVVENIDVNEAFTTFNNFGQDFIKAENLAGSLSGSISLLLPADSLMNPDIRSITAEGRYSISDGALVSFDPVKALSRFISLTELENIKFQKLENDFFIRNNVFYIPQMDIRSSAADLSVNGQHSFDNDYEYHVRMLLSEILSKKARSNKKLSDEFGEIEDDGLGRTSVFLLIQGKGEKVDVSYDMKAQGTQIRENLKKEKQTLKTIINEEYGLYRDTEPAVRTPKRRFRISWDGSTDTTTVVPVKEEETKENFLNRLFKKN